MLASWLKNQSMKTESAYTLDSLPDRNERGAFSIYCDDVRGESTGKTTIVGVYGEELIVGEFPALLPTFFILTTVWTKQSRPFEKLIFRILMDDKVLSEDEFDIRDARRQLMESVNVRPVADGSGLRHTVKRIAKFSPFVLENESILRVRVETEDGELRTSALKIRLASPIQEGTESTVSEPAGPA